MLRQFSRRDKIGHFGAENTVFRDEIRKSYRLSLLFLCKIRLVFIPKTEPGTSFLWYGFTEWDQPSSPQNPVRLTRARATTLPWRAMDMFSLVGLLRFPINSVSILPQEAPKLPHGNLNRARFNLHFISPSSSPSSWSAFGWHYLRQSYKNTLN